MNTPRTVLSLRDRLSSERLPLDLALALSVEVIDAVATAHHRKQAFGTLTLADFALEADGSVSITAAVDPFAHPASDSFAVGAVLYQLFTGLTPNQARAKLSVSPLHAVPPASLLNPAIDDGIEVLLATLLAREPALRPQSLRVVEAQLAGVCDALDLDPSREELIAWATKQSSTAAPLPSPLPAAQGEGVRVKKHVPTLVLAPVELESDDDELDEEDVEDAPAPLRFDMWAAAACAFTVVAFAMATTL